jgi:hypothetical protein
MVMRVNSHSNSMVAGQACIVYSSPEQQAYFAGIPHRTLKGLPTSIDPDRPPKSYKDAMSREYRQSWSEAYDKEYCEFKEHNAFKIIRPEKGIKIHDTLTRLEYKEDNGTDLYASTLKAPEARLLAAIAAEYGCPLLKTNTRRLHGKHSSMEKWEKTKRYTSAHLTGDWNLSLMVMFFFFSKACMAQNRPPDDGIFASRNGWSRTVIQR